MRRLQKVAIVGSAGRENAHTITKICERPRHVKGRPYSDSVPEMFCQDASVLGKITSKIAVGPAAPVFKSLRQIPVV